MSKYTTQVRFIIVLQMIYAAFMVGKLSKAIELEGAAAAGSGK